MGGTGQGGTGQGGQGGGSPTGIACTNQTCVDGDVCCLDKFDMSFNFCAPPGQCGQLVELSCMGPGDCAPNEICCGVYKLAGMNDGYQKASCQKSCNPPGFNFIGIQLCTGDPGVCPPGKACLESQALPKGFKYCDP